MGTRIRGMHTLDHYYLPLSDSRPPRVATSKVGGGAGNTDRARRRILKCRKDRRVLINRINKLPTPTIERMLKLHKNASKHVVKQQYYTAKHIIRPDGPCYDYYIQAQRASAALDKAYTKRLRILESRVNVKSMANCD